MGWSQVRFLLVPLVGALIVSASFSIGLGPSLLIFFVGWPVVGTIVTADDDLPGGWSNPDGTVTPPWEETRFWGFLVGGFAVSGIGFAIDAGWNTIDSARYWLLAVAAAFLAAALVTKKRWLAVGLLLSVGIYWL